MDIYASAALSGLGYALHNEQNTLQNNEYKDAHPNQQIKKKYAGLQNSSSGLTNSGGGFPNFRVGDPEPLNGARPNLREVPSMDNVYSSSYQSDSWATENTLGTNMWRASQNPYESGVVPRPAYASMFMDPKDIPTRELKGSDKILSMSGQEMSMETFTHNNMQPFYSGSPKQNMTTNANSSHFEQMSGTGGFKPHKKEVECFFQKTAGNGNACGFMKNNNEFYINRINAPKNHNNSFPIDQVRVGPGLGLGYTAEGEGGFQQSKSLDASRPKTIDELRSAANQTRIPNKFVMQQSGKGITKRGIQAPVDKNRPDRFFEQSHDQLLRTTGATIREMNRPVYDMKPTARVDGQIEYKGSIGYSTTNPGQGAKYDYGKKNTILYDTGRADLSERTVITNAMSTVKAMIAPLLDLFRDTNKEYTLDAAREFGNMHVQIPSKPTTYDPVNHIMKTTIKETTSADTTVNNLTGATRGPISVLDDAKTTVKETTSTDTTVNNLTGATRGPISVLDDAKTTIKETTIHDTTINNLKGTLRGPMNALDDAKKTIRQSLDKEDVVRNVAGHTYKVTVYNADKMRTTVRESTDNSGSMYGFMGGNALENTAGAYDFIDVVMPDTQKQFLSDNEYGGIAGAKTQFNLMSKDADYNAEIDSTRETLNIKAGYTPNAGGGYTGQDPDTFDMDSKRIIGDSINERETNNTVPKQLTARAIDACEVTHLPDFINGNEKRLDPSILGGLRSNPYSININPVRTTVAVNG